MGEKYPIRREAGQSVDDMAQQMRRSSAGNKLNRAPTYGEVSAELKAETLANVISQTQMNLAKLGQEDRVKRVDLTDLNAVREAADSYLQACKIAGVVPTISGFSAALGYSRQWICKVAEKQTEVGGYLSALFAAFSSCLEQMSLMRQTDPATSIFLMKNGSVGMTDRLDVTAQPVFDPDNKPEMSVEDILKRYASSVEGSSPNHSGDSQDDGNEMPFFT